MLKGEPRGEPKKPLLDRPLIQGILKKSSSPVQTAKASIFRGFFIYNYLILIFTSILLPYKIQ